MRSKKKSIRSKKQNSKKKYSSKKQKQINKRNKLLKIYRDQPELDENNINKYYALFALINMYKLLYEQTDLTWGGIVDPYTYQVAIDYWPGTNQQISEYDKSRINAISYTLLTGDPTWKFTGGSRTTIHL